MNISALDTQVKTAYETMGMSPEEIAVELQIDLGAVKYSLSSNSPAYRKAVRASEKAQSEGLSGSSLEVAGNAPQSQDVSADESLEMLEIMKGIARTSEDEQTRFKAAKYIYEEHKGRNAAAAEGIGKGLSLGELNAGIQRAIKAAASMTHLKPVIDIAPKVKDGDSDSKDKVITIAQPA